MHVEGHQIASHTWSHQNASQLTSTQYTNQMVWNEIALNSILGFFPTYMRPPYSICEKNCQSILSTLGYHVIYFDLDTAGYLNDDASMIQTSKDIWDNAIDGTNPAKKSFLQIEHDIHYQTVYNLTDYILTSLFANGYKAVTVGECLGDPVSNWYRAGPGGSVVTSTSTTTSKATSTSKTSTSKTSTSVAPTHTSASTDGTCGNGVTCTGTRWGSCCSDDGYCGVGSDYCSLSRGCQPAWGKCDGTTTSSTKATATKTTCKHPAPFPGDTYLVEVCKPKTNRFSSHHQRPADTDGPPGQRRRLLRSGRRRPDLRRQQVRHLLQPGGQVQLQHDLVPGYLGLPGRLWVVRLIWSGCVSGWWEVGGVDG